MNNQSIFIYFKKYILRKVNLFFNYVEKYNVCKFNSFLQNEKNNHKFKKNREWTIHVASYFQVITRSNFVEILIKVWHPEQEQQQSLS